MALARDREHGRRAHGRRGAAGPGRQAVHLNAEQYAEVRTPEFRARIGDWESWARLRKGYDALLNVARNVRDVPQAMRRDDLGDITFYCGAEGTRAKEFKDGYGISRIIARRAFEKDSPVEVLVGVIQAVAQGHVVRDFGGDQGRVELAHGDFVALLSKQMSGKKVTWLLAGFRMESGAGGVSYIPASYAPQGSVSRQAVVADLKKC